MGQNEKDVNLDQEVVDSFGHEWAVFDYSKTETDQALDLQFAAYSSTIDFTSFNPAISLAADFGAGSGRWTSRLLPHFCLIYALDPSNGAVDVLRRKFNSQKKIRVLQESVGVNSIPSETLDFAMSLGVLHHIPDTSLAIKDVARKIKPGGLFLCYLYYKLETKPIIYRAIFWCSNLLRGVISRLPYSWRKKIAKLIAAIVYFPLARLARIMVNKGKDVSNFPLHHYANMPFIMLQNDALDRFGTRLEQRFNKVEISHMLAEAGFDISTLTFSNVEPFWTFSVRKSSGEVKTTAKLQ